MRILPCCTVDSDPYKGIPSEELAEYEEEKAEAQGTGLRAQGSGHMDNGMQRITVREDDRKTAGRINFYAPGLIWLGAGLILTFILSRVDIEKELYVITAGISLFGLLQLVAGSLQSAGRGTTHLILYLRISGTCLLHAQLAIVQFFTWFALFSMWIYTTSAVTSHIYGTSDTASLAYNEGANWVSFLFGIYNGFAAAVAFCCL